MDDKHEQRIKTELNRLFDLEIKEMLARSFGIDPALLDEKQEEAEVLS